MNAASQSSTSLEELEAMLASGKLSQHDYDTLRAAMDADMARHSRSEFAARTRPALRKCWVGRQLGGVCAGLGEWLGVEPRLIRGGFVIVALLTGGSAIPVYIVLYAVIPWKESERDQVARFGYGFGAKVLGLWLVLQALIYIIAHWTTDLAAHAGNRLPAISRLALELGQQRGITLVIQVGVLLAAITVYSMTSTSSPMRKTLARVIMGVVLLEFLFVALGLLIATIQVGAGV